MEKTNFKDWYKKKFDPSGCVYPSAPLDIGFTEMCDRVDEYLMEYDNQKQPTPTDKEIMLESLKYIGKFKKNRKGRNIESGCVVGFMDGAKWLRDTYQPPVNVPFEEMDEKRYQLIYSAIPSMVDIIHISDHTREEIANCINGVLGNYQPTEQQNWISVEDRLPEDFCNVIGIDEFGNIDCFSYNRNGMTFSRIANPRGLSILTHWMTLPEFKTPSK